MFKPFALVLLAAFATVASVSATAQTCRWDGTAPFCNGSCRSGESEHTRLSSLPEHWQDAYPVLQNTNFGASCVTGSKALCCPVAVGSECRWDGTAPICEGRCGAGENERAAPPGSLSGATCTSGSKVYCCRSNTGTARAALRKNEDLTTFAALWDQSAGPAWQARHGLSASEYQQAFDQLVPQGYRPVSVRGYAFNGKPTYAAVFEQRPGPAFAAFHNLTRNQFQREFDRAVGNGYRLVDAAGFALGDGARYTAVFEQTPGPAFRAFHGISAASYQREFDRAVRDGLRPVKVNGHALDGKDFYTVIFEQRSGPAFIARHSMSASAYQQAFDQLGREGYRLVQLSSWRRGAAGRYAGIWEKAAGPAWQARHNMLGDVYQEEFNLQAQAGYRLREVSAYHLYE